MNLTITDQGPISLTNVKDYFESLRLGRLYFPNGDALGDGGGFTKYFIKIEELYRLIVQWRIAGNEIQLDSIIAVIAYGSAVEYPGFKMVVRKKFFGLFTTSEMEGIQPKDADFLVITRINFTSDRIIETEFSRDFYGYAYVRKGGIHVVHRGAQQVIDGANQGDTVSQSALLT